jgi:hypothetical protein
VRGESATGSAATPLGVAATWLGLPNANLGATTRIVYALGTMVISLAEYDRKTAGGLTL